MAKQSKKPADLNRLAAAIVGDATKGRDKKKNASGKRETSETRKAAENSR